MTEPLRELVRFAVALRYEQLPTFVIELAEQSILDALGTGIAGSREPAAIRSREALLEETGSTTVWTTDRRADAATAALLNGTAAHALDFDDWAPGSGAHPTVTILPAILAVAERGTLRGHDLLTAFVAGYEFQERLGLAISPSHYDLGFHTTGIVGAFGAAVAASLVLGADEAQVMNAVKLVATEASGLKSVFGSMGKPFNAGHGAANGVRAATLALAAFEGPSTDPVFGPQGFVPTHSTAVDLDPVLQPFGQPWHIERHLFKFYPSCFGTHATLIATAELRDAVGDLDAVESIDLRVPPIVLGVCAIPRPETGLEGKFSLAYTAARGLVVDVSVADFAEPFAPDPVTERLMSLVSLTGDESYGKSRTTVTVTQRGGRQSARDADAGAPRWSSSPREQRTLLEHKFRENAEPVVGAAAARRVLDAVSALRDGGSAAALIRSLGAGELVR